MRHAVVTYSILSRAERSLSTTSGGLSRSLLFIWIAWRILDSSALTRSKAALTPSVSGSGEELSTVAIALTLCSYVLTPVKSGALLR